MRAGRECAHRQPRNIVHAIDLIDRESVKKAVGDHCGGAFAKFFVWLKDEHDEQLTVPVEPAATVFRDGQVTGLAELARGDTVKMFATRTGTAADGFVTLVDRITVVKTAVSVAESRSD